MTGKNNWVVGALGFTGNPSDGHTLSEQLTQTLSMIGEQTRIKIIPGMDAPASDNLNGTAKWLKPA